MESKEKDIRNIQVDGEDAERLDKIRDRLKTKTRPETIRYLMDFWEGKNERQ
jgi:hypothetical protein